LCEISIEDDAEEHVSSLVILINADFGREISISMSMYGKTRLIFIYLIILTELMKPSDSNS
jgi:hypothetical protein